jgi:integrase
VTSSGSVHQRHTRRCPRDEKGTAYAPHKCRGPWAWHLDLGKDPITRKRLQSTGSGYPTRRAAAQALASVRNDLAITGGRGRGMTVGSWLDDWLESQHNLKPSAYERYESIVRLHLKPCLGVVPLTELSPEHLDRFIAAIRDPGYGPPGRTSRRYREKRGLSSASVKRIFACLHTALGVAARRRLIAWSPASVVSPPREENKKGVAWTPEQSAEFLDSVGGERLYAAWHLVLLTGARRGELAGVRWDDIDLDQAIWNLTRARVQVGGTVYEGRPKSPAGYRTVYLDQGTVAVLRAHRARQLQERLAVGEGWVDSGFVLTTEAGEPIAPGLLTTEWRLAVKRHGLTVIRLHDGRHTANTTAAVYAGVADQILIERAGHSKIITNRRYQHGHDRSHREAAESIAAVIDGHRRPIDGDDLRAEGRVASA